MTIPFEWQLCLGIVAFYLFDSSKLLYRDEVMFTRSGGRWRFHLPGDRWLLLGRSLYVANPLTPYAAMVRARWHPELSPDSGNGSTNMHATRLLAVRCLATALLVVTVIALPASLSYFGSPGSLAVLVFVYILIVALLIGIHRHRGTLGLTSRQFWALASDALLCAPFAINAFRKLTLQTISPRDALVFATEVLDDEQLRIFVTALIDRLDADLRFHDDDDPQAATLAACRRQLEAMRT